jgi:tetratricopeptide (TPR) repeat protein
VAREAALEAAGGLTYWLGEMAPTLSAYNEGLALARANGDPARISNALYNLSFLPIWVEVDRDPGERAKEADAVIDEGLSLARQIGDRGAIARCLWAKGNIVAHLRQDHVGALVPLAEAIPIFRELGDHFGLAWALHGEGLARLRTGDLAAARAAFDEQVALLSEARDPSGTAIALANQSELARAEGDRVRAMRLAGASEGLRRLTGAELVSKVDEVEHRVLKAAPKDEGAQQEGLAMTFDQAVAYALRRPAP